MTQQLPRSLYGQHLSVAMSNLADFCDQGRHLIRNDMKGGFEGVVAAKRKGQPRRLPAKKLSKRSISSRAANPAQYKPENGAVYPNTDFGRSMMQIAQLIKAGVGLEVAFTDTGNDIRWDTHVNEGSSRGQLANFLRTFRQAIAAFATDLGKRMDDVVVITMSEFGRTARENGGARHRPRPRQRDVRSWQFRQGRQGLRRFQGPQERPALTKAATSTLTTDFRDVFAEAALKHLGGKDLDKIFPGYQTGPAKFKNFLG